MLCHIAAVDARVRVGRRGWCPCSRAAAALRVDGGPPPSRRVLRGCANGATCWRPSNLVGAENPGWRHPGVSTGGTKRSGGAVASCLIAASPRDRSIFLGDQVTGPASFSGARETEYPAGKRLAFSAEVVHKGAPSGGVDVPLRRPESAGQALLEHLSPGAGLGRRDVRLRPGIEVRRIWPWPHAVDLDERGALVSEVRDGAELLTALDEPLPPACTDARSIAT